MHAQASAIGSPSLQGLTQRNSGIDVFSWEPFNAALDHKLGACDPAFHSMLMCLLADRLVKQRFLARREFFRIDLALCKPLIQKRQGTVVCLWSNASTEQAQDVDNAHNNPND